MDKRWSTFIQTPEEIDSHRETRFKDSYKNQIINAIGAKPGMIVADIGCGAGTLTRKLSSWLGGQSKIIGIDRDLGFIEYSKSKAIKEGFNNIEYINSDAYSIPLPDNCIDISTSHTVIGHVDHKRFLLEQKRLVKSGGRVSFMSIRTDKSIYVNHVEEISEREKELQALIKTAFDVKEINTLIAQHPIKPEEMPQLMEELGFTDISIKGIALTVSQDNADNPYDYKRALIDEQTISEYEIIKKAYILSPDIFTKKHLTEMQVIINSKHKKRILELKQNIKKWNFVINMMIVVSGKV